MLTRFISLLTFPWKHSWVLCRKGSTEQTLGGHPHKGPTARLVLDRHWETWIWSGRSTLSELTGMPHCASTVQTMQFMINTYFLSSTLEFGDVLGWGCLRDQLPIKTLCPKCLLSFPSRQNFTVLSQLVAGEMKHVLCNFTLETMLGNLTLSYALLPFCCCKL